MKKHDKRNDLDREVQLSPHLHKALLSALHPIESHLAELHDLLDSHGHAHGGRRRRSKHKSAHRGKRTLA